MMAMTPNSDVQPPPARRLEGDEQLHHPADDEPEAEEHGDRPHGVEVEGQHDPAEDDPEHAGDQIQPPALGHLEQLVHVRVSCPCVLRLPSRRRLSTTPRDGDRGSRRARCDRAIGPAIGGVAAASVPVPAADGLAGRPLPLVGSVGRNSGRAGPAVACSNPLASLISVGSLYAVPMNVSRREPERVARRHADQRVAGDRRRARAGAEEVVAVDEVGRPGRRAGRARRSRRGRAGRARRRCRPVPPSAALRSASAARYSASVYGSDSACSNHSWRNHFSSTSACASLNAMASASECDRHARAGREVGVEVALELVDENGDLLGAGVDGCRSSGCRPGRRRVAPAAAIASIAAS